MGSTSQADANSMEVVKTWQRDHAALIGSTLLQIVLGCSHRGALEVKWFYVLVASADC